MTVPRAPVTIGITVTFKFHSCFFFQFPTKVLLLILLAFFQFYSVGSQDSEVLNPASSLFRFFLFSFLCWLLLSLVVRPRFGDPLVSQKSQMSLCVLFSKTDSGLHIYHLFVWSNFNILHNSLWIILPTQSDLVLFHFCANLLHSLIKWLIVSYLSPHNPHLLFCSVLSIQALIWLVLMSLFCAVIRRDSASLLRFPFLSHIHVFSYEMSLVSCLKRP